MSFINSCIENSNANTSKLVRSEITVISLLMVALKIAMSILQSWLEVRLQS